MKRLVGLVALMVVLSLLACSFSAGVGDGGAGLKTAVVCSDLAEDYGPVGHTDVFGPDDDFNVSIEYSALEEAQTIGVKWLRGDELLYEQTVTMDAGNAGEGYAGFSLTNAEPWAAGDYHADIYLDGEFDHTVNFRVIGASVGDGGAGLKTAVVCSDLAEDYGPVGPTDVFGPDDDFNISVEYSALEEDQIIGVKWFQGDELLYEQTVTMDAGNAGEGYAGFSLTNAEPWAAGDYHVDIYLDGEFDHTVNFRVTGAGVGDGGASLNTAVVCRDLADDYSPSGPTDVFGPDDELNVSIKYSDLEVDQTIGVKWFHGDEMIYEQTVTIDAAGAGDGDAGFTITNTELWATGDYHADIYLDGDFDHTAGFRVE